MLMKLFCLLFIPSVNCNYALDYTQNQNFTLTSDALVSVTTKTSMLTCALNCMRSEVCVAVNMKCEDEEREDCTCDLLSELAVTADDLTLASTQHFYVGPGRHTTIVCTFQCRERTLT